MSEAKLNILGKLDANVARMMLKGKQSTKNASIIENTEESNSVSD